MNSILKKIAFLFMTSVISFQLLAQDKAIDVTISTENKSGGWYLQPWVWIVGGALFILLLVALVRGNKK